MPPVRGNGLAVAGALAPIISSPISLTIGFAGAKALGMELAEGMGLAVADALGMGLLILLSSIIWSLSICATAAGANASAVDKPNRAERTNPFLYSCSPALPEVAIGGRTVGFDAQTLTHKKGRGPGGP